MIGNFNLAEMSIYSFHYCLPNRVTHEHLSKRLPSFTHAFRTTKAASHKTSKPKKPCVIEVPFSSKQSRKLLKDVERPELAFSWVAEELKKCTWGSLSLWSAEADNYFEGVEKCGDFVKLRFFGGFGPSNDLKLEIQCYPTTRRVTGL